MKRRLLVVCAVVLLFGLWQGASFGGCASEQDADRIARALADRLTEALEFEDDPPKDSADNLPEENAGDASFPQVTALSAPSGLRSGEAFTLRVQTDFSNTADVAGAIVYVNNSGQYLNFTKSASSAGVIEMQGRLKELSLTDPKDPMQWVEGRAFKLKVAMRSSGMEGTPGIGNFRKWQINVAQTQEDVALSNLCRDICDFLERCDAEWSDSQSAHGEDPYDFAATDDDYCMSICQSEEAAVKAGSSPTCWAAAEAYVQCLFNLPCEVFLSTEGEWYEQGENACRYFHERMDESCQDAEWYREAFGDADMDQDVDMDMDIDSDIDLDLDTDTDTGTWPSQCTDACQVMISCGFITDGLQYCQESWCPQYEEQTLQCVANFDGECMMIIEQCGVQIP